MRDIRGHCVLLPSDASTMTMTTVNENDNDDDDDGEHGYEYGYELSEEKFRVDRKKLEQMLLGYNVDVAETAENFFKRVMDETNTVITWPSKLKIGAKSKKDPHIKVCGQLVNIRLAKSKINAVLDMKSSKVTLKMDVAHTDHSHAIGRRGCNIQEVMDLTETHIHFPDSNRTNSAEKSNQVSIAGQPACVEIARQKIRGMLPLTFTFDIPIVGGFQHVPDPGSILIQTVENQYDVKVKFGRSMETGGQTVSVRGVETNANAIMHAVVKLVEHYVGAINRGCVKIRSLFEIGPQHHAKVKELVTSEGICVKTGTTILFPDSNRFGINSSNKSTVIITGDIEGVYNARLLLMGCLPLILIFDLNEDYKVQDTNQFMYQYNVSITVRSKPKMSTFGVVIKGIERDSLRMFEARRLMLNVEDVVSTIGGQTTFYALANATQPNANFFSQTPSPRAILGQTFTPANIGNSIFQNQISNLNTTSHLSGGWSHGSYVSTGCLPVAIPSVINQGDTIQFAPLKNLSRFRNLPSSMSTVSSLSSEHCSSLSAPSSTTSSLSSPSESPPRGSPVDTIVNQHGYSNEAFVDLLAAFTNLNSGDTQNSFSTSRSETSDTETIVPEKDKSWTAGSVDNTPRKDTSVSFDYDVKRVMAAKAMKLMPEEPEIRVPTSSWSGYGFSLSMPEAAIRELRKRNATTFKKNGNMNGLDEMDKDPWKDTNLKDVGVNSPGAKAISTRSTDNNASSQQQKHRERCMDISLGSSNYIDSATLPKSSSALMSKCTDLTDLLRMLGLSKYIASFQKEEVDFDTFVTLSDQELKDLGITTFGARRKMLLAISNLKPQQSTVFSVAPGAERKLSTTKKSTSSESDGSPNSSTFW